MGSMVAARPSKKRVLFTSQILYSLAVCGLPQGHSVLLSDSAVRVRFLFHTASLIVFDLAANTVCVNR
jgi:hypothetical protein